MTPNKNRRRISLEVPFITHEQIEEIQRMTGMNITQVIMASVDALVKAERSRTRKPKLVNYGPGAPMAYINQLNQDAKDLQLRNPESEVAIVASIEDLHLHEEHTPWQLYRVTDDLEGEGVQDYYVIADPLSTPRFSPYTPTAWYQKITQKKG